MTLMSRKGVMGYDGCLTERWVVCLVVVVEAVEVDEEEKKKMAA